PYFLANMRVLAPAARSAAMLTSRSPLVALVVPALLPAAPARACVDKCWRVDEALLDGQIVVRTRRGKRHTLSADDPHLRPVSWWEWLLCWHRFPPLEAPTEGEAVKLKQR